MRFVVAVSAIAVLTAACAVGAQISVFELEEGDCFDFVDAGNEVGAVETALCIGRHDGEVVGFVDFEKGDYPGAAWFNGVLANKCNRELEDYLETANVSADYIGWLYPDEQIWREGVRTALCYVE